MKNILVKNLFIISTILILVSCGGGNSKSSTVLSKGIFKAKASESQYVSGLKSVFQKSGNALAKDLNKKYILPKNDVVINFTDCGTTNAFYTESNSQVKMCHEMFIKIVSISDTTKKALGIYTFILAHELGHAFIHEK